MVAKKVELMQGTLDVMVLQTLSAMGSLHGYGIAAYRADQWKPVEDAR